MFNFIQKGSTITASLAFAVNSGQLVLLGNGKVPAIASGSYAANTPGEYVTKGVYELPSAAAGAAAVGDKAYWDSVNNVVTITAQDNDPIGHFASSKVANDATARIRLWL
ncbi:DUF2190 family protein [Burkholderia sp. Bp9142]|uniref:DUF2190 family protein n=1 Tax=Burkholderia sp. Bp9142 TaxID=2184573 RepID=UPI000F5987F1|nr:DUF2190 family protein [Burkholderia sp. Bp9142]RQR37848.1 DUF2190 family protein [Burkholderia sp. Bp9142]